MGDQVETNLSECAVWNTPLPSYTTATVRFLARGLPGRSMVALCKMLGVILYLSQFLSAAAGKAALRIDKCRRRAADTLSSSDGVRGKRLILKTSWSSA